MAFGGTCGFATWFLYQKSLSKLILHISTNHKDLWANLGNPEENIPAYQSLFNTNLRQFISQKKYESNSDVFIKNQGSLVRQRLLFCIFCLVCLLIGLMLSLLA